jgi:hypothetical protein
MASAAVVSCPVRGDCREGSRGGFAGVRIGGCAACFAELASRPSPLLWTLSKPGLNRDRQVVVPAGRPILPGGVEAEQFCPVRDAGRCAWVLPLSVPRFGRLPRTTSPRSLSDVDNLGGREDDCPPPPAAAEIRRRPRLLPYDGLPARRYATGWKPIVRHLPRGFRFFQDARCGGGAALEAPDGKPHESGASSSRCAPATQRVLFSRLNKAKALHLPARRLHTGAAP